VLFSELSLSDKLEEAREELKDYLEDREYTVKTKVPIRGSKNKYDLVVTDQEGTETAILIGRYSVRYKRLAELKRFKGDSVYLLRGNARIEHDVIEGVNVINVMSKGSL